jgi:hypothetical protein
MSFEGAENWSHSRSKASEKLVEALRARPGPQQPSTSQKRASDAISGDVTSKDAQRKRPKIRPTRPPAFVIDLTEADSSPPSSPEKDPAQHLAPPSVARSSSPSPQVFAVRVGWFPGIYRDKKEADLQTKNYPLQEQQAFTSVNEARQWLAEHSPRVGRDRQSRPVPVKNVDRAAFMAFVSRSWATHNQLPGIDERAVAQKLQHLLREAEEEKNAVNWNLQPLPQVLIKHEKESSRVNRETKLLGLGSGALAPREPATTGLPELLSTGPANAPAASVCSCGKPVEDFSQAAKCAGANCANGTFHRACVGLAKRPVTEGWRCWRCRPKPGDPGVVTTWPSHSPNTPSTTTVTSKPVPVGQSEQEPDLHPEQATVVDAILSGKNVFYTGSAGTGKSTVLKAFCTKLKARNKHVDIIAPSGIAALNVGGTTIYAYAGWHPDLFKEPLKVFLEKSHMKSVRKRLCRTDVLVIDEISMLERDLLTRLDAIMREVRHGYIPERGEKRNSPHSALQPFGGAQIVVTGE